MVLSQSQTLQLNKEIVEYLANNGYEATAKVFAEEAALTNEVDPDGKQLELRFKSIVALQRKINGLEDEVKALKEQLANCKGAPKEDVRAEEAYLPQLPPKHALKGHRANVTSLAFHPQYTQLASASEDGSVKFWDFENG
jgi:platelet-activating factor acetylhydrolase IB subunit alpha